MSETQLPAPPIPTQDFLNILHAGQPINLSTYFLIDQSSMDNDCFYHSIRTALFGFVADEEIASPAAVRIRVAQEITENPAKYAPFIVVGDVASYAANALAGHWADGR